MCVGTLVTTDEYRYIHTSVNTNNLTIHLATRDTHLVVSRIPRSQSSTSVPV